MSASVSPSASITAEAGKYLTFLLGREHYGIPVLKVREIIRLCDITPVPQMPAHIRGVLNLRGKIVPVVDLRIKFSLPDAVSNERTCIIVVQVDGPKSVPHLMSIIVDTVDEVVQVAAEDIEEPPDFGSNFSTEFIRGIAKIKGVVQTLLDVDRIVGAVNLNAFG